MQKLFIYTEVNNKDIELRYQYALFIIFLLMYFTEVLKNFGITIQSHITCQIISSYALKYLNHI
jgi:hypothetical protein